MLGHKNTWLIMLEAMKLCHKVLPTMSLLKLECHGSGCMDMEFRNGNVADWFQYLTGIAVLSLIGLNIE